MIKKLILIPLTVLGVLVGLLAVIILMTILIDHISYSPPSAEELLSQKIVNYEYFLGGREITWYSFSRDSAGIETSVSMERIPELLRTSILVSCADEYVLCSDPVWAESDKTAYELAKEMFESGRAHSGILWEYTGRTFEPGEFCATAKNRFEEVVRPQELICINTNDGSFSYKINGS